jgi:hypothetical protein
MPGMTQSGIMSPGKDNAAWICKAKSDSAWTIRCSRGWKLMMQAGVAGGLSAAEALATQVFECDRAGRALTFCLPLMMMMNRAVATAIATGRATGVNAYPAINDAFMEAI